MKRRIIAVVIVAAVILTVLFLPIPKGTYDDGGTREYMALTYRIIVWNKIFLEINEDGSSAETTGYHKTSVFWFKNDKSLGELWEIERENNGLSQNQAELKKAD